MPLDLGTLDRPDARLVQVGLKELGFYGGTTLGLPGPRTRAAYGRYRGEPDVPPPPPPPADAVELSYGASVRKETEFPGEAAPGTRGRKARLVQEWVSLHGFRTSVDGQFGPATARVLRAFQTARDLAPTGVLDQATWERLTEPLTRVLAPVVPEADLPTTVLTLAKRHLAEHPVEVGGANAGPWVRLYMDGNEGPPWPWCAGFVTFVIGQAAQAHGADRPVRGSFSCDALSIQARDAGRRVSDRELGREPARWSDAGLGRCSVFLVRRTSTDWTHTGFAFGYAADGTFSTVEGNTNDEGSREGFEVCQRTRGRASKDFIRLGDLV